MPTRQTAISDIMGLIDRAEKAFGGCKKCYGKGYSTYRHGLSSGDDSDLGVKSRDFEPKIRMIFCECDRGKQLEALIDQGVEKGIGIT